MQEIKNKIIKFYKKYNIEIIIYKIIASLSVTSFYAKIDTTETNIKKVEKLIDDLTLYIGVKNINFKIDFENKSIVFEIPNKERKILKYIDMIKENQKEGGLTVSLGSTTSNSIYKIDITKTPHLLIAGTTGSGKSILINTILLQLLQNYTPKELQLTLIDPKQVELSSYANIPHLQDYIIKNLHDAKNKLKQIINTIETRYKILENNNNKNIENYNKTHKRKIPYVLIVIDELADLILQDRKEKTLNGDNLEDLIVRIAQIGRAAGVHLIVSTQRPSADIITGLIKANIPSRIALSVASGIDSKVILDMKGAEKLTGKGDMFIKIIGENNLTRLQGAYIEEQEQENIIKNIIEQNKKYIEEQEKQIQMQKLTSQFYQLKQQQTTKKMNIEIKREKNNIGKVLFANGCKAIFTSALYWFFFITTIIIYAFKTEIIDKSNNPLLVPSILILFILSLIFAFYGVFKGRPLTEEEKEELNKRK